MVDSWTNTKCLNNAELIKIAFERSETILKAVQGFQSPGISSFNRNKLSEACFSPSEFTGKKIEEELKMERDYF
ncbi:hypothetical protein CEXT_95661 [Caerostris extrusa]|uniref:Uncharacterized protein n=1 Tax=Caerostris extrusa TaxID=172846 RepID=A0AAV4WG54_CAEEX|nr:hypothetical protein CEXT_95661 [Caerostris extrusa]